MSSEPPGFDPLMPHALNPRLTNVTKFHAGTTRRADAGYRHSIFMAIEKENRKTRKEIEDKSL